MDAWVLAVLKYFACEAAGNDLNRDCESEKKAYQSLNNVAISVLAYILLGIHPILSLLYVIPFR